MLLNCGAREDSWEILGQQNQTSQPERKSLDIHWIYWVFAGRTDAEAPIFWLPDAKIWHIGRDPDGGKDWGQEKGVTEDELIGWHHRLNWHEFEQTVGDSEGQGSLLYAGHGVTNCWTQLSDWTTTNCLAILWWFFHTLTWIGHRYTYVPCLLNNPPITHPLHLTSPGCHRTPSLGSPCLTSDLYCLSVLHMAMYIFLMLASQIISLELSPLHAKFCSLCLSLLCCPT